MKIHPRYYPVIIIGTFIIFLLIGILLGFGPERGGEGRGQSMLMQFAFITLEAIA